MIRLVIGKPKQQLNESHSYNLTMTPQVEKLVAKFSNKDKSLELFLQRLEQVKPSLGDWNLSINREPRFEFDPRERGYTEIPNDTPYLSRRRATKDNVTVNVLKATPIGNDYLEFYASSKYENVYDALDDANRLKDIDTTILISFISEDPHAHMTYVSEMDEDFRLYIYDFKTKNKTKFLENTGTLKKYQTVLGHYTELFPSLQIIADIKNSLPYFSNQSDFERKWVSAETTEQNPMGYKLGAAIVRVLVPIPDFFKYYELDLNKIRPDSFKILSEELSSYLESNGFVIHGDNFTTETDFWHRRHSDPSFKRSQLVNVGMIRLFDIKARRAFWRILFNSLS